MTRIVTSTYRYKRPPKKRKAVALEVPVIVTKRTAKVAPPPANDDRKSAIVITSKRSKLRGEAGVPCCSCRLRGGDCALPGHNPPAAPEVTKTPPRRHWRSYGNEPLPTGPEALGEPLAAFPSWFLRIECDRCGKVQMVNEAHAARWRPQLARHHRPHAPRRLRRTRW